MAEKPKPGGILDGKAYIVIPISCRRARRVPFDHTVGSIALYNTEVGVDKFVGHEVVVLQGTMMLA